MQSINAYPWAPWQPFEAEPPFVLVGVVLTALIVALTAWSLS